MNTYLIKCMCDLKGVSINKTFIRCLMFIAALVIGLIIGTEIQGQLVRKAKVINQSSNSIIFNPFELFEEQARPKIVIGESNYNIAEKERIKQEELKRDAVSRERRIEYKDSDVITLAESIVLSEFSISEWEAFYELIDRESGWKVGIKNKSSGACGLGQALPCSKMENAYGDPEGEIRWALEYVKSRYGSPSKAILFHNSHNWY